MGIKYSNNAKTTLSSGINDSVTSATVASGAVFPALSGGDYFYATIETTDFATKEIVKVTARSGDTLTIVRAQDNTSAAAFSSGDFVELRVTAAVLEDATEPTTGITAGTVIASKAIITDSNKDITGGRNITISGELDAATLDISGDADIDGTLEADAMTLNGTTITTTATLSTGISNTNVPIFTTGVADDDFLRVAGTSIEGRSAAEVLSDIGASAVAGSGSIVTTGALNSGSITSGFGAIDNGSSAITTTGTVSFGSISDGTITITAFVDEDNMASDSATLIPTQQSVKAYVDASAGSVAAEQTGITSIKNTSLVVGRDDDNLIKFGTDNQIIFEVSGGDNVIFKASGEIEASSLDISGDVDVDGTLETDALSIASTTVTSTAAELNILDGVTSTAAELNYLDITTLGTTQASKAVTTDANGDVLFPDGDKVRLGAGADLILQHDGSHSYIQNSTGNLNLQGKSGENGIVLVPDGAITLYHDNAAKLATNSGGVTITGELDATTGDFSGAADFGGNLAVGTGRGDANEGGQIDLYGASSYTGYDKIIDSYQQNLRFFGANTFTAEFFATGGSQVANLSVTGTVTATTLSGAISGNISQLTNNSGYVTSSGVTSVATSNGLTGGTITGTGTLSMSGSYSGDFSATGNITAYSSDSRLKDFKGKIDNPLDKIEKLNGYYYEWNDTAKSIDPDVFKEGLEVGVNAQEVEAVLPEVITEAPIVEIHKLDTDYKTVYYDKIVPLLIEGIKELKKEIEELKAKGSA